MPSILLVDDNAAIRKSLRSFLQSQGYEVCGEAEDGFDAIEKAGTLNHELIILDLSMPRMNGLEAAPRLRAMLPDVPIVLFTLHRDAFGEVDIFAAGITAMVEKSGNTMLLVHKMQELLEHV
jgi:CheY-like chemotaxis protein